MTEFGPSLHYGRGVFIRSLPKARRILDIGGVALGVPYGALVLMGYPYPFEEIVIVDLPSEDRHELYQDDQRLTSVDVAGGRVSYRYHSMTDLSSYPSASFDMVYSGESIEHITRAEAELVLAEVWALRYALLNLFHAASQAASEGRQLSPDSVLKIRDQADARKLQQARKLLDDFFARGREERARMP